MSAAAAASSTGTAETLGCIHQKKGLLGVLVELMGDGGNRHHLARVPEQIAQHHQTGAGGEGLGDRLERRHRGLDLHADSSRGTRRWRGSGAAPVQRRRSRRRGVRSRHSSRSPSARRTPQRQHAAAGDVLREARRWGGTPQHCAEGVGCC